MEQLINLKQFRQIYNLTQAEAAESIGIDQRQWNRYENGINELPIRYLKSICLSYNVDANWLIGTNNENREVDILFNKINEILNWAEYQKYIKEETKLILVDNIYNAVKDIKNSPDERGER